MRYPSTHKEETRKKLIGSARAIAKRGGFGTTGVDELMASIGLTGGAFYGHFPSKEALFAELVEQEISNSAEMLAGDESSPPHRDIRGVTLGLASANRSWTRRGPGRPESRGCLPAGTCAPRRRSGGGCRRRDSGRRRQLVRLSPMAHCG